MPTSDYWTRLEQAIIDKVRATPDDDLFNASLEALFVEYNIPKDEQRRLRTIAVAYCWERAIKETLMHEGTVH